MCRVLKTSDCRPSIFRILFWSQIFPPVRIKSIHWTFDCNFQFYDMTSEISFDIATTNALAFCLLWLINKSIHSVTNICIRLISAILCFTWNLLSYFQCRIAAMCGFRMLGSVALRIWDMTDRVNFTIMVRFSFLYESLNWFVAI